MFKGKKIIKCLALFAVALSLTACGNTTGTDTHSLSPYTGGEPMEEWQATVLPKSPVLAGIPEYTEEGVTQINGNKPFFEGTDYLEEGKAVYSPLDSLGRCGPAMVCAGPETMAEAERQSIADIRPTGWHTVKYDGIAQDASEPGYLYNRSHLIAHCLNGANSRNDQVENLITGTRYMNTDGGMLPYEIQVAEYIETTGDHVLYRVTPIFSGDDLLARGVLMAAKSLKDGGLTFCVFAHNVQPGITIDYATGESDGPAYTGNVSEQDITEDSSFSPAAGTTYVINTNTKKFHLPSCDACTEISTRNRAESDMGRNELFEEGYLPCGRCNP